MNAPTEIDEHGSLQVYVFDTASGAGKARHALGELNNKGTPERYAKVAVISRADDGEISIRESADLPYRARIASALPFVGMAAGYLAHLRGLLKTSASAAALIGGAVGLALAITVNVVDLGFVDTALMEAGRQLENGTSALVLIATPGEEHAIGEVINFAGGKLVEDALAPEVSARIRSVLNAGVASFGLNG